MISVGVGGAVLCGLTLMLLVVLLAGQGLG